MCIELTESLMESGGGRGEVSTKDTAHGTNLGVGAVMVFSSRWGSRKRTQGFRVGEKGV